MDEFDRDVLRVGGRGSPAECEETAATRSLLNTAKLMEDNPLLVRLKELETLERVADKVGTITVVGGLDALLEGAVTLRPK